MGVQLVFSVAVFLQGIAHPAFGVAKLSAGGEKAVVVKALVGRRGDGFFDGIDYGLEAMSFRSLSASMCLAQALVINFAFEATRQSPAKKRAKAK